VETIESDICSIKLQTSSSNGETQALRLINVYNPCPLSTTSTEGPSTIPRLNELIKDDCEQLIVGDFNLHHPHWGGRRCFTRHTAADALLDTVTNARLGLLLEPGTVTREAHNQSTTIDLAFGSEKIQSMIHKCEVRTDLHQGSDHLPIATELCLRTTSVQSTARRLWKKMDTEALNAYLRIHLTANRSLNDKAAIDDRVAEITRTLQEAIEESTPWAKPSNRARDFWNQKCSEVVTESRRLRVVWKMQGTLEAWNDYLKYNDHKNKVIRETKRSHFRSQMHELSNEPKSVWRFAKWARTESQLPKKLPQFPSLKSGDSDHIANSFEEKTEVLRKKFFPPPPQADISDISGSFIPLAVPSNPALSQDEVRQAIRRVKADKAPGASGIPNRALQAGLTELTPILTGLFNACVTHKYHPKQFRRAQTIVLRKPKKSDYTDPKAYRPIALLDTR